MTNQDGRRQPAERDRRVVLFKPVQELPHFLAKRSAFRRFVSERVLFPSAPETTCIGPVFVVAPGADGDLRHAAAAGRKQGRMPVEEALGRERLVIMSCVASSIISTTPSTFRSAGVNAPISMPRRRAIDERTWSRSSFSPSISLDLMTSSVSVCRTASARTGSRGPPCGRPNAPAGAAHRRGARRCARGPSENPASPSVHGYSSEVLFAAPCA